MAMDAANRLSAIAAEMGQLNNEIQEHRRVLNSLLGVWEQSIPLGKKRAFALSDNGSRIWRRQQALRAEQQALIVQAVTHGPGETD